MVFLYIGYPLKDFLLNYLEDEFTARKVAGIFVRVLILIILFFLIKKNNLFYKIGLNNLGKFRNIKAMFIPLGCFLIFIINIPWYTYNADLKHYILFFFSVFLVVVLEELFFRGLIFNLFYKNLKSYKNSTIISSIIFGLIHYFNLFSQPENVIGITKQVFFAFSLGVFFCGLFIRTGNI